MTTGPNRTGRMQAPIVENAWGNATTGASIRASPSQIRSASWNSSMRLSRPTFATAEMTT